MTEREQVAQALAIAMVSGSWTRADLLLRTRVALGRQRPPGWLLTLVDDVLDAYRDRPDDRPRELAAYLLTRPAWVKAWAQRSRRPHIVELAPVPSSEDRRRWPTTLIRDHADLARLLDIDQGELAWFADTRSLERTGGSTLAHYRWHQLPKRDGVRLVAAPKPRLKEIQRRLLRHLLVPITRHPAAHGARAGTSVRTAVLPHSGRAVVIRADLQTFFAAVPAGRVWGLLRTSGLREDVAYTVTGLVTTVVPQRVLRALPRGAVGDADRARLQCPHLPQGAPTSPALADLVAFGLDRRLTGLAQRFDATYTRYVDDLTFSGGPALRAGRSRFVSLVDTIARAEGFALNERKTVVLGSSGRQALLGTVVNERPGVPRPDRDALRAVLHNCAVRGWRSQAAGDEQFPDRLLGRISWVAGINAAQGARLRAGYDAIDWT